MILLITNSNRGQECAGALQDAVGEKVELVDSVRIASGLLRQNEYSALIIDQALLDAEPMTADVLLQHAGMGMPVYVNFGVSTSDRIVREVKAALKRCLQERQIAMKAAESQLRNELKDDITGILLASQLALSVRGLPTAAQAKIKSVCDLAQRMRSRLED